MPNGVALLYPVDSLRYDSIKLFEGEIGCGSYRGGMRIRAHERLGRQLMEA